MEIGEPVRRHVVVPLDNPVPETPEVKPSLPEKTPEKQPAEPVDV